MVRSVNVVLVRYMWYNIFSNPFVQEVPDIRTFTVIFLVVK